ncbi:MAG: RidA family protein [Parvibaculaceae bacterium]
MQFISTTGSPRPLGHYSQGIAHAGLIFVSGQLPLEADGTHRFDAPFDEQVRQAVKNLLAVVSGGGGSPAAVIKVTAYIVGAENWPVFDTVYAAAFGSHRPARSVVPVPALHHGYLVELDAVAAGSPGRE